LVCLSIAACPKASYPQEFDAESAEEDLGERAQESPSWVEETLRQATMGEDVTLLDLFVRMGWFVYPLGLFSLWAVYLIFANLFILSEKRLVPSRLAEHLEGLLIVGNLGEVEALVDQRQDLLSQMVAAGVRKAGREPHLIETAMEGAIGRELAVLRNRIRRLADIGNLAPMIGLLGTVWGMVRVFKEISVDSSAMVANWSSSLAAGVAQAMLTTVAGLLIGIPALFFYYIYRNKLAKIVGSLESHGTDLAELLSADRLKTAREEPMLTGIRE
jgi:biopolymer transport protein ExbB